MAKDTDLFVGIQDPRTVRFELLGSAKLVINNLQDYERVSEIREEKIKYLFELRRIVEEVTILNRKLKQALPKTSARTKQGQPTAVARDVMRTPQLRGKLQELEDELARVEEKLSGLR